jgi:virulence-associated protein VagC
MGIAMKRAEIVRANGSQFVRLPEEYHVEGDAVFVRRQGAAIVLEPAKMESWPPGFFERIRIDDPAFGRPDQGPLPPTPVLE